MFVFSTHMETDNYMTVLACFCFSGARRGKMTSLNLKRATEELKKKPHTKQCEVESSRFSQAFS